MYDTYGADWTRLCAQVPGLAAVVPAAKGGNKGRGKGKGKQQQPAEAKQGGKGQGQQGAPGVANPKAISPKPPLRQSNPRPGKHHSQRLLEIRPGRRQWLRQLRLEDLVLHLRLVACRWQRPNPRPKGQRYWQSRRAPHRSQHRPSRRRPRRSLLPTTLAH